MSDSSLSNSSAESGSDSVYPLYSKDNDRHILAVHGYYLGEKISSGTFATVRLAEKKANKRVQKMAVKVIDKAKKTQFFIEKLLPRELALWPELNHKNIIKVYQIIHIYERIYMFMELAHMGSVIDYLQENGAVDEEVGRTWGRSLCQALRYCHRRGIAHRDVKCDNILLDKNYEIKLGDFGFCKNCCQPYNDQRTFSSTYCGRLVSEFSSLLR